MRVSGILCNYCRKSPNATYVSVFGNLAACGLCKLSTALFMPSVSGSKYLIHWRDIRRP
jgi:hypothetical protein